jgi:hypothetical protein
MSDLLTLKFTTAAAGVYGEHFVSRLAAAKGINLRTVQRWANGQMAPPQDLVGQLATQAQEIENIGFRDNVKRQTERALEYGIEPYSLAAVLIDLAEQLK